MLKLFKTGILFALAGLFIMGGCAQNQSSKEKAATPETDYTKAVAVVHGAEGSGISGIVTLTKTPKGVRVQAQVSGVEQGKHGFHIHQYGDCTAADFTSAGGHFAPEGDQHGEPDNPNTHDGDLGNIVANSEGKADLDFTSPDVALNGPKSVIGRAIVIHEGADDLNSQPSGAAGARIACGVIGIANPG